MLASMEGEETYSPAEASRVLGRSGRKITARRIRQMLQAGSSRAQETRAGAGGYPGAWSTSS